MKIGDNQENHNLEVLISDLKSNPRCPHGPMLLFSRRSKKGTKQFYACSACRDRKLCNCFVWADEKEQAMKSKGWKKEYLNFTKGINHRKLFILFNKVSSLTAQNRTFCQTCSLFTLNSEDIHKDHKLLTNLTNYQMEHPSEVLPPLDNAKKEAQYLFSKDSTKCLVNIFKELKYKYVICIGTPRIHEYIQSKCKEMTSILLDIDKRYHSFFGPLQYCWYNSFNNHFFFEEGQQVFNDFLTHTKGENTVLVTDPPFGGRIEPLVETFNTISNKYKKLSNQNRVLPIFWIFPYFMESQLMNFMPDLTMLDYKVEYDNHPLFQNGSKGRKQGSPVRIFTNIDSKLIKLPVDGYKLCKVCDKWVAKENKHCQICNSCTSKNGETYRHCDECHKCVKPNWKHCTTCNRCAQAEHKCIQLVFNGCKQPGHKSRDCQKQDSLPTSKRKSREKTMKSKKAKLT